MAWIILSFIVALVLDTVSLGDALQPYNPPWTLLVLIHWCWIVPARIGPFAGFCVGLLVDTLSGSVLGLHALGTTLVAYLAGLLRAIFSRATLWQQAIVVWGLVLVYKAVVGWIQSLFGPVNLGMTYWFSSLVAVLAWPLVSALLKELTPIKRRA
jgi:rod shape-determining protein MreD